MKLGHTVLAILFLVSAVANAQVVPAATGPAGLAIRGTLHYALRYSQTAQYYGGAEGDAQRCIASGEMTYANLDEVRPFSMTYSGGDMWAISGTTEGSGVFQHLLVSQGVLGRKWAVNLSDDVSYLPQAPIGGFSGIAGVGTVPAEPGAPDQPILTLNTRSIDNKLTPQFTQHLDYATSLVIGGSYAILRFPDGDGLETNQIEFSPEITRRLNARNSITGQYSVSRFTYPGYLISLVTQSAQFGYQRTWNRQLKTSISAGPERTHFSGLDVVSMPSGTVEPFPPSTGLTLNANMIYDARSSTVVLGYTQATTGGAGVATEIGVHNHDANAAFTERLGRKLTISFLGAYMRTQGFLEPGVINAKYGGVAATQQLGRYITVFANYTVIQQSSSAALPANAITGLPQVITFGIGYTPRELHFRR